MTWILIVRIILINHLGNLRAQILICLKNLRFINLLHFFYQVHLAAFRYDDMVQIGEPKPASWHSGYYRICTGGAMVTSIYVLIILVVIGVAAVGLM